MNKSAFSIYDASAGSGKTFTLVKEYLKIILSSKKEDAYKNILAITFTNKAVGEMKSRVLDALSEFSKDRPDGKAVEMMHQIQQETNLSEKDIHLKSKAIIRNIIHNYAAFDISTIDKFTHKVIRTFAHDLNLPATFEVSLETDNLLVEAIDALIAQVGEDQMLTKLLVDFTLEKTDDDKSWDVSRDIKDIAKLLTNENSRQEIEHFKEKSVAEFVSLKESLTSKLKEIESFCVEQAKTAFQIIQEQQLDETAFTRKVVYNYFQTFSKGKITNNTKIREYLAEGNRYAKKIPQFQKDAVDAIAPRLLNYFEEIDEKIKSYLLFSSFLKNINPLSLLNRVSQELHKIQEEKNILSISEFNTIIHNEIQKQPAPFIYERMGERYKHFFIDEFQDTSQMQWENLIPLIDNALSSEDLQGEKGSLMIVGDPKQSIYRWRGGKAEQFIELSKGNNPFINPDKSIYSLDTNWRSYSEIIDFNNEFFKFASSSFQNADYRDLYQNHSHQKKNNKTGGFVSLSFLPAKEKSNDTFNKDELYLNAIQSIVDQLLQKNFSYRDMVILTRKKDPAVKIAAFLTEKGIPIVSSETLLLQNSAEVKFVLHVLHYIKNRADDEAKANFLYYIGTYLQKTVAVHDFIFQGMRFKSDHELEKWLQSFDLDMSFQQIRKKTLYEAVEIIINSFIQPSETNAYLQDFLDRVLEHDLKKRAGISDFLDYWDMNAARFSIPSPEGNNAIRIMTIHKAKGLEFPVVIFPFAEESYSNAPKDKLWIDPENDQIPLEKILVDNTVTVEELGESAKQVYQQKKEEELLDNINILYVALTRAEEQLYVISSMNLTTAGEPVNNNMSTFFLNYLKSKGVFNPCQLNYHFGSEERISLAGKAMQSIQTIEWIHNTLPLSAIKIVQKESLMWGTHQQKAIEYGNVLHEILSYVKTVDDIALAISIALENGLINSGQKSEVTQVIHQICTHPELIDCFALELKILNEQTIIRKSDSLIKPDRILLTASGTAMLVDYKTGEPNSKHLIQLDTYEQALEIMGYKVIKKVLVYIGETLKIVTL